MDSRTVIIVLLVAIAIAGPMIIYFSITEKNTRFDIPQLKPPVENSTPQGLKEEQTRRVLQQDADFSFSAQVKDRFFSGMGPTSVYDLLNRVDTRTREINERSRDSQKECLTLDPVEVDIPGWPGEDLTMWMQCYDEFETIKMMFGKKDDTIYLYEKDHVVTIMAYIHLEPSDEDSTQYPCCYQVGGGGSKCTCDDGVCSGGDNCRTIPEAWPTTTFNESWVRSGGGFGTLNMADVNIYFSVGGHYGQTQSGSRGLFHLEANPKAGRFQATAAGIGLGFCGVQFASDGETVLFHGSQDGVDGTCEATDTLCVSGDLETEYTGSECEGIAFSLPPIGRQACPDFLGDHNISGWDESHFPGGELNLVDIDYDELSSVHFGPDEVATSDNRNFNNN